KFAEYMAAGLPIVITPKLGDYSEAVTQSGLGIVLPLQSSDDVTANRLAEFIASADFRQRRASERCVKFATDKLSWRTHRPAVLGVYRRLSAAGTGPASSAASTP